MENFSVEFTGLEYMETLLSHRMSMWKEIRPDTDINDERFLSLTRNWLKEKLGNSSMTAIIAKTPEGNIAGSVCILIQEDQPRPNSSMVKRPYLLSMFIEPEYRNLGIATLMVKAAITWAMENGYDRMSLHASDAARSIYEKMGFRQTNEMRLFL